MRSLIPSPLWQMNTAVLTPQWSGHLLPSYFICELGGSCKGKRGSSIMQEQSLVNLKMGWIWGAGSRGLCYAVAAPGMSLQSDKDSLPPDTLLLQSIIHSPVATTCPTQHISNSTLWCLIGNLQLGECELMPKTLRGDIWLWRQTRASVSVLCFFMCLWALTFQCAGSV